MKSANIDEISVLCRYIYFCFRFRYAEKKKTENKANTIFYQTAWPILHFVFRLYYPTRISLKFEVPFSFLRIFFENIQLPWKEFMIGFKIPLWIFVVLNSTFNRLYTFVTKPYSGVVTSHQLFLHIIIVMI